MKQVFSTGILLSVFVITMNSCKKDNTGTPATQANDINLASNATLGKYLTNKQGQALYMFANDADGTSTCTGGCQNLWPAFTGDISTATVDATLSKTDFGNIINAAGKKQITYKGWPLYTYSPLVTDSYGNTSNVAEGPGSTKGDALNNLWFIAKTDYTIMLANKQLTGLDGNNYKSDYNIGNGNTVYFTNGNGRTIYNFSVDSFNINKFTKADLSNNPVWPMYEQEEIVVPSILNKTLFATITVAGKKQLTYKGWPLYNFGQDAARGSNKGVSVTAAGKWPVAVKDIPEARR